MIRVLGDILKVIRLDLKGDCIPATAVAMCNNSNLKYKFIYILVKIGGKNA